jgi:hypothetical protein
LLSAAWNSRRFWIVERAKAISRPLSKEIAMSLADTTKEDAARAVKDAARNVERQIRSSGEQAYDTVKTEAERLAVERRNGAASYAHDIADAFESASNTLQERGRDTAARLAHRAAEELGALGQRVEGQDVSSLLHSVEDFARRRPGLFLGGAFLLSFALVRYFGRPALEYPQRAQGDDASDASAI